MGMLEIPLGWLQLKHQKLRFAVALAGVALAVVLILMQLGFREAMFESAVRFHDALDCEVVLISNELTYIVSPRSFSQRRLWQARGVPGVAGVTPVYLGLASFKNPETHGSRSILVMGIDPTEGLLRFPGLREQLGQTVIQDAVLFDAHSRPEFGPVAERVRREGRLAVDVNHRQITIAGLYALGTSFGIDGSLVTSETNFLRLFPHRDRGLIEIGAVRLEAGADPAVVRDAIRARVDADVLVLTRQEFRQKEIAYWDATTPIGYVFSFGVLVGLVVGGIIVYQILFSDVNDHLPEYATLKAMGYSNAYLAGVVLQQAVILAGLGFLPAMGLALLLYRASGEATRLPIVMTWERALLVFVLTLVMCSASALLALRKVRTADPAEIF
ncbi:ABC transporter permease DevC [Myxococcota bacterium]|nr:ABC transporter permease DevC [Myxococcota bacterium]